MTISKVFFVFVFLFVVFSCKKEMTIINEPVVETILPPPDFDPILEDILWEVELDSTEIISSYSKDELRYSAIFENLIIYYNPREEGMIAFDRYTGEMVWNNYGQGIGSSNAKLNQKNGLLYIGVSGNIKAVDPTNGNFVDEYVLPQESYYFVGLSDFKLFDDSIVYMTSRLSHGNQFTKWYSIPIDEFANNTRTLIHESGWGSIDYEMFENKNQETHLIYSICAMSNLKGISIRNTSTNLSIWSSGITPDDMEFCSDVVLNEESTFFIKDQVLSSIGLETGHTNWQITLKTESLLDAGPNIKPFEDFLILVKSETKILDSKIGIVLKSITEVEHPELGSITSEGISTDQIDIYNNAAYYFTEEDGYLVKIDLSNFHSSYYHFENENFKNSKKKISDDGIIYVTDECSVYAFNAP